MADNNTPQSPAQTPIVDQIANEVGLPEQPQNVALPSTQEAQQETEQQRQLKSDIGRKKAEMAGTRKSNIKQVSDIEAQAAMLEDLKQKEQEESRAANEKNLENLAEEAEVNAALEKYKEIKNEFSQRGLDFQVDENFETLIADREQKQEAAQQALIEDQEKELQKQQQLEEIKQQQLVKQEQQALQKQEAVIAAQELQHQQKTADQAEKLKARQDAIEKEDAEYKQIDPERFWNSKSTGQKITATLGVLLAGIGAGLTGQPNQALAMLNKAMDNDLKAQNLNNEQFMAKKAAVLRNEELKLKKMQANTNNELVKAKIGKIREDLKAGQAALIQQRLMAKKLQQGQEVALSELPPERQKAAADIRKEYNTELNRLKTRELIGRYTTMQEAINAPEDEKSAADLNLIFSYMKILDPASVVREGEFATVANAGSIPSKIIAQHNKILNGGRLSDTQRRALGNQASSIMKNKMKQQKIVNDRYEKIATSTGVPPSVVIEDFSNIFSLREKMVQNKMAKKQGTREEIENTIDNLIKKGKLPAEKYGK